MKINFDEIPRVKDVEANYSFRRLFEWIDKLTYFLDELCTDIENTINYNAERIPFKAVASVARPTPEPGEMMLWNDTAAVPGQPSHYLVANHDGTIITFASEEINP